MECVKPRCQPFKPKKTEKPKSKSGVFARKKADQQRQKITGFRLGMERRHKACAK
jgi:hypothetical protein